MPDLRYAEFITCDDEYIEFKMFLRSLCLTLTLAGFGFGTPDDIESLGRFEREDLNMDVFFNSLLFIEHLD